MPILIVCSPSTGSSLLRRILNRHSQIYCGPESSMFAKKGLYQNWNENRTKLFKRSYFGLPNMGWHHYIGINALEDNDFTAEEINRLALSSERFKNFINAYYKRILNDNNKTIWAEKTPSNAFAISDFLKEFPEGRIIHIVRNPYDTIASLCNRGMTIFNAISVYLLNTSSALAHKGHKHVFTVKYENLVNDPIQTVRGITNFLNVGFEESMIRPDENEAGIAHMSGWNYKETSVIGNKSVGRFLQLPSEVKSIILTGSHGLECLTNGKENSVNDLCEELGYEYQSIVLSEKAVRLFKREILKDKIKRVFKNAFFDWNNYPMRWKK